MQAVFPVYDVSSWTYELDESTGTHEPQWLSAPDGTWWVHKPVRTNSYGVVGDDWSEKIAAHIGRLLGVPTADVELAERSGVRGSISKNFMPIINGQPAKGFAHGNVLLHDLNPAYSLDRPGEVQGYTLDAVWAALQPFAPPSGAPTGIDTATDAFAGYLMFDAVVANIDRHHLNWGVIGRTRLAESYDHASGYGVILPEHTRHKLLTGIDGRSVVQWARRGRSRQFQGKPNLVQLAADALIRLSPTARGVWLDHLDVAGRSARRAIIDAVPADRMTAIERVFADTVMEVNRGRLLDEFRTQP